MEDVIAVIDGRPILVKEIEQADMKLRNYLRHSLGDPLDQRLAIGILWRLEAMKCIAPSSAAVKTPSGRRE